MTAEKNAKRLVIGLTGPLGSGVTTVSEALAEHGFQRLSMSEPIKQELCEREDIKSETLWDESHVKDFRKKLQDIGNEFRDQDPTYWAKKAIDSINDDNDVVIDGIRNKAEVDAFRQQFFQMFFLIGIHAAPEIRQERLVNTKYDGNLKAFLRDDKRDTNEDLDNGQQVEKCMLASDYIVVNETDFGSKVTQHDKLFEELRADLDLMRNIDKPNTGATFQRPPTPEETYMATAFAQSHASQCLKRHVGAVIVDIEDRALSLGYNENPIGMEPCRTLYQYCFKDIDMEKKLEDLRDIHCPQCGTKIDELTKPWDCTNPECDANLKTHFFPDRNMVLCTAIHAEERAIRSLGDRSATGGTIYSTTCPCFQCARYIVDAEIKRVVYVEAYPVKVSIEFLRNNCVTVEPFRGFMAKAFNQVFKQVE